MTDPIGLAWQQALELEGFEDYARQKVDRNWKNRKAVPWAVIGEFLYAQQRPALRLVPRRPKELQQAVELLEALYQRQAGGRWEWKLIMDQLTGSDGRSKGSGHRARTGPQG